MTSGGDVFVSLASKLKPFIPQMSSRHSGRLLAGISMQAPQKNINKYLNANHAIQDYLSQLA